MVSLRIESAANIQESSGTLRDADLVASVSESDSTAGTTLCERYSARIYFLALSVLHYNADAQST